MSVSKAVRKYSQQYSSLDSQVLAKVFYKTSIANSHWQQATVIPAFDETPDFLQRFAALPESDKNLLIVVGNLPDYATKRARQQTLRLVGAIIDNGVKEISPGLYYGLFQQALPLLLIDSTQTCPWLTAPAEHTNSGVGFARKLGMDMALWLWTREQLKRPWFYSTDADAHWPAEYLQTTPEERPIEKHPGGIIFPCRHLPENSTQLDPAAALYEISLRYYVQGLRFANSPWAFHTIGSTLLIHAEKYAQIRGFPQRQAGEDFYLLNKLAKISRIKSLAQPMIQLSDRASQRVPFGTGPAVNRIQQMAEPEQEFCLYHPGVFSLLKIWSASMPRLFTEAPQQLLNQYGDAIDPHLLNALLRGLEHLGLNKTLHQTRQQSKNAAQFEHHCWQWFDSFRTLKLIHWLRDNHLPSPNFAQWRDQLINNRIEFLPAAHFSAASHDLNRLAEALWQWESAQLPDNRGLN